MPETKQLNNVMTMYDTIHDVITTYGQNVNITIILGVLEAIKLDLLADYLLPLITPGQDDREDNTND